MDSGIYQLTFLNGDTYVGKSLHLELRYRQHCDKLSKSTAARNVLQAYYASNSKFPAVTILLECHPDVLDEYEGYFINWLKPTLNTQIPEMRTEAEQWALIRHMEAGSAIYSFPTILIAIENLQSNLNRSTELVEKLEHKIVLVENKYIKLDESWDIRALRDCRAMDKYTQIEGDRDYFEEETKRLTAQLRSAEQRWLRVLKANWWQRLWKSW